MSQVFFDELEIPEPDVNLEVGSGRHGQQTAAMLQGIESVLLSDNFDVVLVYGDTNSTLACGLAAAKLHIPVTHIEAGLRSFNRRMPEEVNRVLVDHLSTLLLCPTQRACANLSDEGIREGVHLVGDVMLDALHDRVDKGLPVQAFLTRFGLVSESPNLRLAEPLGFSQMLAAEREALAIVTDSGGVQKEASWLACRA